MMIYSQTIILLVLTLLNLKLQDFDENRNPAVITSVEISSYLPSDETLIATYNVLGVENDESYVYILDQRGSAVYQFDFDGNYIRQIGRAGHGPGELINPLSMSISNKHIYTFEQGKMQVQKFDQQGQYLDTIIMDGAYSGIDVIDNRIWFHNYYYPGMPHFLDMPGREGWPMFTLYDIESGETKGFGDRPELAVQLESANVRSFLSEYNNIVYAGLMSYSMVQLYSTDGEYIGEIKLNEVRMNERSRRLESRRSTLVEEGSLIMGIQVNEFGIFVIPSPGFEIGVYMYHFSHSGDYLSTVDFTEYYESDTDDYYLRSFTMVAEPETNRIRAFLHVHSDMPRVLLANIYFE